MDEAYYYDVEIEESATHHMGAVSYLELKDKPKIEGITLEGDKSFRELQLNDITPQEIDEIIFGGE